MDKCAKSHRQSKRVESSFILKKSYLPRSKYGFLELCSEFSRESWWIHMRNYCRLIEKSLKMKPRSMFSQMLCQFGVNNEFQDFDAVRNDGHLPIFLRKGFKTFFWWQAEHAQFSSSLQKHLLCRRFRGDVKIWLWVWKIFFWILLPVWWLIWLHTFKWETSHEKIERKRKISVFFKFSGLEEKIVLIDVLARDKTIYDYSDRVEIIFCILSELIG